MTAPSAGRPGGGVGFLLAQLGQRAADRFAERISVLELTPPQAGILRAIAGQPGRSQQALSEQLGLLPSRVVAFVDELEQRGCVQRRRNLTDRRLHALHLTEAGHALMKEIGKVARKHDQEMTAGLSAEDRVTLQGLLARLADQHGLAPGVHPGYRGVGRPTGSADATAG
ncbi:MAG: MarR family winged helix-turn-helix transcriptional regulator [Jatrophihabitans sp.]